MKNISLEKIKTYKVRVEHDKNIYEGTVWKYPSNHEFYAWEFLDSKGNSIEQKIENEIVEYLQKNWKV